MGGGGRQWGEGEKDRAEREVPVRGGEEVQEVSWGQLELEGGVCENKSTNQQTPSKFDI
jgi:hypothetical protein